MIVLVALGLALGIQAWIVKPYRIPSGSMEPTLMIGQRVLVDRIGTTSANRTSARSWCSTRPKAPAGGVRTGSPHRQAGRPAVRGTAPEEDTGINFIKRIVAGSGRRDLRRRRPRLSRAAGTSSRARAGLLHPRVPSSPECNFPTPIKIPAGHWFMMGDNRGESDDSRFWGPVPPSWIIGEAFATYWPPDRIGFF